MHWEADQGHHGEESAAADDSYDPWPGRVAELNDSRWVEADSEDGDDDDHLETRGGTNTLSMIGAAAEEAEDDEVVEDAEGDDEDVVKDAEEDGEEIVEDDKSENSQSQGKEESSIASD